MYCSFHQYLAHWHRRRHHTNLAWTLAGSRNGAYREPHPDSMGYIKGHLALELEGGFQQDQASIQHDFRALSG